MTKPETREQSDDDDITSILEKQFPPVRFPFENDFPPIEPEEVYRKIEDIPKSDSRYSKCLGIFMNVVEQHRLYAELHLDIARRTGAPLSTRHYRDAAECYVRIGLPEEAVGCVRAAHYTVRCHAPPWIIPERHWLDEWEHEINYTTERARKMEKLVGKVKGGL